MADLGTYIHGTEPAEQRRLAELNRLTNDEFVRFLQPPAFGRILEVGSGLGILARHVAGVSEGVRVVGVEMASAQIAAAVRAGRVTYVRADAHALPLADGTFDLAYARYLLEHVRDPSRVLTEMRRVLGAGGRVAVLENDISLVRFDPPCPRFDEVWAEFAGLQRDIGGDGHIGRRLFRLLRLAGFRDVELSMQPEVHWYGSPRWRSWVENIIGNVESGRRALVDRGLCTEAHVNAATAELAALLQEPDASATFVWNRASGVR